MRIVIAPRARRELANQLGYLVDQGAITASRRLEERLTAFFLNTLCQYPKTGTFLEHRELWETWFPERASSSGTASRVTSCRSSTSGIQPKIANRKGS